MQLLLTLVKITALALMSKDAVSQALFPGGGGISPFTDGGCCWGGWGAGGLVVVSYWQ